MRSAPVPFVVLLLLAPAAAAAGAGMDARSLAWETSEALPAAYATTWAGAWIQHDGWGAFDADVDAALAAGATPLVQFWYWGDSIAPACVANGCHDALHDADLSRDAWFAMGRTLGDHLAARLEGRSAIVIVETEFNKNGMDAPDAAAAFDADLARMAGVLHATPGVRVGVGFGDWAHENWARFPQAVAAADLVGFQAMRASTRHADAEYRAAPDAIVAAARELQARFGKPLLLGDLALSSWGGAGGEALQADVLRALAERAPELRAAGVEGVAYRSLRDDPSMDPANYFGEAERAWGLERADGSAKPALDAWRSLAAAWDEPSLQLRAPAWKTEAP